MAPLDPFGKAVLEALNTGAAKGRKNLPDEGIPVFYVDSKTGLDVMEEPG